MRLITGVRIRGFRSILDAQVRECGEHFALVGRNSCGKSNFLRALNVFFNGETSPGVELDFERDLYFRPARKQKKRIEIEVNFELPDKFKYRQGLNQLDELGQTFSICKVWELDQLRRVAESAKVIVKGAEFRDPDAYARDFLSLVRFRYIPNRTVPAELLKDESQVIASAIFKKMKETSKADQVLKNMSASAGRLLSATSDALKGAGSPLSEPNILASNTLGEMLRMAGFQAKGLNGAVIRDEDWGSGHQAFFLMNLLREVDTDYSRQFGWRQACIWAVEEPESGLHHDLQTNLARQFLEWAGDKARRLQIFTTTHSAVMTMSADSGCLVELGEHSSEFKPLSVPELVREAEDKGVTSHVHPALSFPFHPVVLVEGAHDETVLNDVAARRGYGNLRFLTLPALDPGEARGVDGILSYLRKNPHLVGRRLRDSPLLVLVDWDVSNNQLLQLQNAYGEFGKDHVVRCDKSLSNPKLGDSFRGLEKFYPESVVEASHHAGECVVGFPAAATGEWSISADSLAKAKHHFARRVVDLPEQTALQFLNSVLEQVVSASRINSTRSRTGN